MSESRGDQEDVLLECERQMFRVGLILSNFAQFSGLTQVSSTCQTLTVDYLFFATLSENILFNPWPLHSLGERQTADALLNGARRDSISSSDFYRDTCLVWRVAVEDLNLTYNLLNSWEDVINPKVAIQYQ